MSASPIPSATSVGHYLPVRQAWLERRKEPIVEAELPIIDSHHHLWDRLGWRYLLDDLLMDIDTGLDLAQPLPSARNRGDELRAGVGADR
jgi:hypothetical protein